MPWAKLFVPWAKLFVLWAKLFVLYRTSRGADILKYLPTGNNNYNSCYDQEYPTTTATNNQQPTTNNQQPTTSFYSLYTLADILGPAITRLSIQATLAFNNKLTLVQLNVGQFLAALENAVSAFLVHDGSFPQLAGLRLDVNTTMPPVEGMVYMQTASRLETVILEGRNGEADTLLVDRFELMVDVKRTFVLATNSFFSIR
jgi:hypothetical protein